MVSFTNFLFAPANRADRVAKAMESGADMVCVDLEDSVPAAEKDEARTATMRLLSEKRTCKLAIRSNGLKTLAGLKDLAVLADSLREGSPAPDALFLPMVESPTEVDIAYAVLADYWAAAVSDCALIPLIETVQGLRRGDAIAASRGVAAMMFGGGDFSAQLGVPLAWQPTLAARAQFLLCCASAQVTAIDVPYIDINDMQGLREECEQAKALGFHAKAAIHPKQLATIAAAMRPSASDVSEAKEAIAAYDAGGGKVVAFRGRMLEAPMVNRYRRILAAADSA